MPKGTLFATAQKNQMPSDWSIFQGATGHANDFWEQPIMFDWATTGELIELSRRMFADDSISRPLNDMWQREGLYDDAMRYWVFEPADTGALIAVLQGSVGAEEQNG